MEYRTQGNRPADRATEKESVADYLRSHDASEVASDARAKAEELVGSAREKASQAGTQAADTIDEAMTTAGQQMSNLAQTVRERAPQGRMTETAAEALERSGRYLQQADVQTVRHDLEDLIRRRPTESLLVGLGLGFLLARSMRR